MKFIDKFKSVNFNKRKKGTSLKYIILHYTAMKDYYETLSRLCEKKNKLSSHFLVNKYGDIFYLVDVSKRAWHAGKSNWKEVSDINSESIGIEIDNSGHFYDFENYTSKQIKSLIKLLKYISRLYKIKKHNILGHSDISPYRKIDPGEKFPWIRLKKNNLSFLPNNLPKNKTIKINKHLDIHLLKKNRKKRSFYMLSKIGYDIQPAKKNNKKYAMLIKAYQMHYRQSLVSGKLDEKTYKLIQSHFNELLT